MSDLIDKKALYNSFAMLEAAALEQVQKHMYDEDLTKWYRWSVILQERTAYKYDIMDAPIIEAVPKNMVFHVEVYDDMTEKYSLKEMTLAELLDKFTDEGYPDTLGAPDTLEEVDETF